MRLDGIGVSPGLAVGPVLVVEREAVPVFRLLVPPEAVECEIQRFTRAVEALAALVDGGFGEEA